MTHLQLELSRGAYKVAFIFAKFFTLIEKVFKVFQDARQKKANQMIADRMKHEYPHETYGYVLRMVEEGRIGELRK